MTRTLLRDNRSMVRQVVRAGMVLVALGSCAVHPSCKRLDSGVPAAAEASAHAGEGEGEEDHADRVTLTGEAIERHGVRIGEARMSVPRPRLVAPARIGFNAEAQAHVGSPVRGRAVEIPARLGDAVKKGDPLVVIESPELGQAQADFLQRRAVADAAGPQADLAQAAWDRAKGLHESSQGISLTEVQRREAEYRVAVAAQRLAAAAAMAAENALHVLGMDQGAVEELAASGEIRPRHTILAAIDGQVVEREITLGELVSPDRESLMVLADTTTLWVLAEVPEARVAVVAVGARAFVRVGSGGEEYEGQVAFVSPMVNSATRTAQARIDLPGGALAARPGMFAQVEIVATTPDGVAPAPSIAVPEAAVQTIKGRPVAFVPVVGQSNTFQKRALTVGPAVGGLAPVFSGLVEGEQYVEAGSFILKAEMEKGSGGHED